MRRTLSPVVLTGPLSAFGEPAYTAARRYLDLILLLAARIIKVRYRGSHLGVVWSLLNPLLMTAVYSLIFGTQFKSYYDNSLTEYILAVFTGLTVVSFFSSASSQALTSIVANGMLLNKVSLPVSLFPISYVAANLFQLAVTTLPLLVVVTLWRSASLSHAVALLAPLLGLMLTTAGFSLALSSLYVFFRDLPYLYEIFTFVMWITTPLFYPAAVVPTGVKAYLSINPLAPIVEAVRAIALRPGHIPFAVLWQPIAVGACVLVVGAGLYAFTRNDFMDLL
jgi:homopolymeric O-antigen transport system permease protein